MEGYSIWVAATLAVWAYIGIVLQLGPGLSWQDSLAVGAALCGPTMNGRWSRTEYR